MPRRGGHEGVPASRDVRRRGRHFALGAALIAILAAGGGQAYAARGTSTLKKTIEEGRELNPGFFELKEGPGESFELREELANAQSGRGKRRKSLIYVAQLTDFQLADEESPARVEFADRGAASAWRPQEAFHAFAIDESMRVINSLSRSPVEEGNGDHAKLKLGVLTGDRPTTRSTTRPSGCASSSSRARS